MKLGKSFSGLFLLAVAVFLGFALMYLPNWIMTNYGYAASLGAIWGKLYLAVVGTGGVLILGSALWIIWSFGALRFSRSVVAQDVTKTQVN